MTAEEWRPVVGFPDYLVSDEGRVASTQQWRGSSYRLLKSQPHSINGYPYVQLYRSGKKVCRSVHGLVALAFLGPRPAGMEVCHGDGDPANSRLSNLRYGTKAENELDKLRHGTHPSQRRPSVCINGHDLTDEANAYMDRRTGRRYCRPCTRVNSRRYRARRALRAAGIPSSAAA